MAVDVLRVRASLSSQVPSAPAVPPVPSIAVRMRAADAQVAEIHAKIDRDGRLSRLVGGPGTLAADPDEYARGVSRLGAALGKSGLALFSATQLGLFMLNRHGKIWNPATLAPPPILQNFVPAALDVLTGTPRLLTGYDDSRGGDPTGGGRGFYEVNHGPGADDIHLALAEGRYNEVRVVHYPPFLETVLNGGTVGLQRGLGSHLGAESQLTSLVDDPTNPADRFAGIPMTHAALLLRNKYTVEKPYDENAIATVDALVGDALSPPGRTGHLSRVHDSDPLTYQYRRPGFDSQREGVSTVIGAASRAFSGGRITLETGEFRPDPSERGFPVSDLPLAASAFAAKGSRGVIPSRLRGENDHGFVTTTRGQSPTDLISDDVAYLPLSFTDLRPVDNAYRTVYFRPLNVKLRESFSPQWNKGKSFGRVDAVATYEGTARSWNLTFDMQAFGPEDLANIYQKLNWLVSMVYPEFDKDLLYLSGPVVRMRVGDVMNALGPEGCRGLPGIIESLDFDYSEAPWELQAGLKVPMRVPIALNFTVLHDRPIGRGAQGKFGGLGTIRDGRFFAPGLDPNKGPGATDDRRLPEADSSAFRSIARIGVDDYETFRDAKVPKSNK